MTAENFPPVPFGTEDFEPKGGGLDFLGLRVVNLRILARDLLPGINNATSDVGTYMLGTWLPWKFQQLSDKKHFTTENYDCFCEAVQIAISHCQRKGAPAEEKFGSARTRIGVEQELGFPTEMRFAKVNRTAATSIFAAPLYGPSLRSLGLHCGFAAGEGGRDTAINMADAGADAEAIAHFVDERLKESHAYGKLVRLDPCKLESPQLDDLGLHGLHPASYRDMPLSLRQAFARRLLPKAENDVWNGRALSAMLLRTTLQQRAGLSSEQVLRTWHTGMIGARPLKIENPILAQHRELWSLFMARQYQRYCLESFMHCFEQSLSNGARTVLQCTSEMLRELGGNYANFYDVCAAEAQVIGSHGEMVTLSGGWNARVHGDSANYDWGEDLEDERPVASAMRMLARWHLRTFLLIADWKKLEQLDWDGSERISILWFSEWIAQNAKIPLARFLEELLTQFVFAQHLRVAMGRFDGRDVQRLRFCLDDSGIVRTAAVEHEEPLAPSWMADRFKAFVSLLSDLGIVQVTNDQLAIGAKVDLVPQLE